MNATATTTAPAPVIELVKPLPNSEPDHSRALRKGDFFDRGERLIMVDGKRWGRTRVKWRGCHGTVTTFEQDQAGEIVEKSSGGRYEHAISVRSMGRRDKTVWKDGRIVANPDFKTSEELALIKARELVAAGKLRDPAKVRAENEAASARYLKRVAENEAAEEAEFQKRAMEACGANDPESETVRRVVAAMRWAQSK